MFRDQDQDRRARRSATATEREARRSSFVSIVLVVGFAATSLLVARVLPAEPARPTLLLLPFVVHSAEDPSYVRGGLSDMLAARFARIGGLNLIVEEDADKGTSNLVEALEIADTLGADYVLFGSFTRFGKGASLDVQCAPAVGGPSREPLREIFVHSGSIGEIIPDLDELAGKVSRFARGEQILAGPAAAGGGAIVVESASAAQSVEIQDISDLEARVAALEAAIVQLMDNEGETIELE